MSPGCGHTLASSNSDDFYSFDVKTIMFFFFHFVFFSSTHGGGQRTVLVVLTFCQGGSRDQTEVRLSGLEVSALTHSSIFLVLI